MTTELQRIIDGLGHRLQRNVSVDDWRLRQLAFSSHEYGAVDPLREQSIFKRGVPSGADTWTFAAGAKTAEGPFRPPLAPEIGATMQRLCVPIRADGTLLGFIWILEGDNPLNDAETEGVLATLDTVAILIQRDQLALELHRTRSRELLRDLVVQEDTRARERAAAELVDADLFVASEPAVAVVLTLHPGDRALTDGERNVLEGRLERIGGQLSDRRHIGLVRRDHALLLLSDKDPLVGGDAKLALIEELVRSLDRDLPEARVIAGIGEPVPHLRDFDHSYGQAERAARVARVVEGFGSVAAFGGLGVYGLLARLPADELSLETHHPGLQRLLDLGPKGEQLAGTLEAFLDHAGDVQAAAEQLYVHRTTLYYRLQRIEELTGAQLTSGEDRLALHLGLKIARLNGRRRD
ncbi:PucR family transcriptional regulator [Streptomyces sp. NPDC004609]|uniref:PucR family transcriptional regulator n=1 Tax=Streptomyces sp. NPDC004609 TaxID=3364704 RepID=UPI0036C035FF